MEPRISIVTACFNADAHLEQAVRSVLEQGYPNLNFVVIDGGSKDRTLDILARYRDRIDHMVSEPDKGISDAFNKGIEACDGEVVGIVSADDYLLPKALEQVATHYLAHGRPDVVHGNIIAVDPATSRKSLSRPDASLKSAFFGQPVKHGATFVTKATYERHGMFDLRWKCAMDYDLILRFILAGCRFSYLDAPLAAIRMGGVNIRQRALTRRESRDIAVRHGLPRWRAELSLWGKIGKDAVKSGLGRARLNVVADAYRRMRGVNVPLDDDNV